MLMQMPGSWLFEDPLASLPASTDMGPPSERIEGNRGPWLSSMTRYTHDMNMEATLAKVATASDSSLDLCVPPVVPSSAAVHDRRAALAEIKIPVRFEKKHFIPTSLLPDVRAIILANLAPDPHATKQPFPGSSVKVYTTYTMHLDTENLSLTLKAKDDKLQPRFKLRIRCYEKRPGDVDEPPVALQVKVRTPQGWVSKTEVKLSWAEYHARISDLMRGDPSRITPLKADDPKQYQNLLHFCKLVRELDAKPVAIVGYERESYFKAQETRTFGQGDSRIDCTSRPFYSRATIDGRMRYLVSTERFEGDELAWHMPQAHEIAPHRIGKLWRPIQVDLDVHGRHNSCYVLELKGIPLETERWIHDLESSLRTPLQDGFSKVYQAMTQEMALIGEYRDPWGTLYGSESPYLRRRALLSNRTAR